MAEAKWQNVKVELLCYPLDNYDEIFFCVPGNIDEGLVEFPEPRLEAIGVGRRARVVQGCRYREQHGADHVWQRVR